MAAKSNVVPLSPSAGRKSAYVARNRAALIRAAQLVFAEQGPTATMEAVAAQAEVAASTVYKHFETKENLLSIALLEAFSDWFNWVTGMMSESKDPLTSLVFPMRLFYRLRTTHPHYAHLIKSCFGETYKIMDITNTGFAEELRQLNKNNVLTIDNLDLRVMNHGACLAAILKRQLDDANASDEEADTALEVALGMLCISPAKAKKLAHAPLPVLTT
jgi:AcrR family transcriptional regulator